MSKERVDAWRKAHPVETKERGKQNSRKWRINHPGYDSKYYETSTKEYREQRQLTSRLHRDTKQEETKMLADNSGLIWAQFELDYLILNRSHYPLHELAFYLGRTLQATAFRCQKLGLRRRRLLPQNTGYLRERVTIHGVKVNA